MKILILYDGSGPKYWRLLLPCFYMPGVELVVKPKLESIDIAGQGIDIVFFNRVLSNISIEYVMKLRNDYGFKLVVDFDDHWRLGPDHYLYENYKRLQISEIMEEYIKLCDGVTVTHERLYSEAVRLNPNCHILPNAIPKAGQFTDYKRTVSDKIRLFWAGGVTHKKDIQVLANPIKRINRPGVQWVMGGYVRDNPEWQAMASAFTNGGGFDNKLFEALPVDKYYACYSECDIALIPLLDTAFNSHKSNLKILEAANVAAPVVVSKVHPYLGFPSHVVNYVSSQSDWYRQTTRLLNCMPQAIEQGRVLQEYCDYHYNFTTINLERKQIFEHVCSKPTSINSRQLDTSTLTERVLSPK